MLLLAREDIIIGPRQRSEMRKEPLEALRDSILEVGLLNPPTFRADADGAYHLVAGERRMRAIDLIAQSKQPFRVAGWTQLIEPGFVPGLLANLPELLIQQQAELYENVMRVELPWPDRTRTLAEIHRLKTLEQPDVSLATIAREIAASTGTSTTVNRIAQNVRQAVVIERNLHDPAVAGARTADEAFLLSVKREREQVQTEIIKRRHKAAKAEPQPVSLMNGDSFELLPKLPKGRFDLILMDPPYGINANKGGFRQRAVHHHDYSDTKEIADAAMQLAFLEGFRVTKTRANLWSFIDIRRFNDYREMGQRFGWDVWPFPVIWVKGNEGLLPGFSATAPRHVYEALLYATKGKRGLTFHPVDVLSYPRVKRTDRIYAAQKPLDLIKYLIEMSTTVNDEVLDPFMGAGTTMRAARIAKRRGLGIELSENVFQTANTYVFATDADAALAEHPLEEEKANEPI